jgi:hypothetical protein
VDRRSTARHRDPHPDPDRLVHDVPVFAQADRQSEDEHVHDLDRLHEVQRQEQPQPVAGVGQRQRVKIEAGVLDHVAYEAVEVVTHPPLRLGIPAG